VYISVLKFCLGLSDQLDIFGFTPIASKKYFLLLIKKLSKIVLVKSKNQKHYVRIESKRCVKCVRKFPRLWMTDKTKVVMIIINKNKNQR